MSLEKVQLQNGLTLYHDRIPGEQTNGVTMFVPYGSVNETAGDEGTAHALQCASSLETDDFATEMALNKYAKLNGMVIVAEASYTNTLYSANGLCLEPNFVYLSQVLQHPHLPKDKITTEIDSIRREAIASLNDTDTMHTIAAENAMFGVPFGRSTIGFHDKLDFDADQLQALHRRHYKLGRMSLIVSGKAKLDETIELAERYFEHNSEPHMAHDEPATIRNLGIHHTTGLFRNDSENVRIQVSYPMAPEFRKLYLSNRLAFDIARLAISNACFQSLRYDKGVSYNGSIEPLVSDNHPDAWSVSGNVTTDKENIGIALGVFDDIFSREGHSYTDDSIVGVLAKIKYMLSKNLATVGRRTYAHTSRLESQLEPQDLSVNRRKLSKLTISDIRTAVDHITQHAMTTPKYTHLTGKRAAIGDVERIIESSEIA
ncbi:MAG: insulinase family protein [Candidatus Saccharimonadales bacterium]